MTQDRVIYGIASCDTVKRARAWLVAQAIPHQFHDFARADVPLARLDAWLAACGWETVLNRKGTTWRKLDEAVRAAVLDAGSAREVMLAHPSCIKRPVVDWADGGSTVGFDAAHWQTR